MDADRFDLFARTVGRRGLLGVVLGLASAAGATPIPAPEASAGPPQLEFCGERSSGERCKKDGQCCSGRCTAKKRKGKRRRKGRCQCSQLQQRCGDDFDCCGTDNVFCNETTGLCDGP